MNKPLNALILDDSQSDALLLLHELRRGGFAVNHVLVDNEDDFREALYSREWDIILSDYSMPSFDAPSALKITRSQGFDLPFIVISGTVGEEAAVLVMKSGANDFFSKGNLRRIVPTVERELREATERRKRDEAEARFTTAFHRSPVGTIISRLSDGMVLDVNDRFLEDYNIQREHMVGQGSLMLNQWLKPEHLIQIDQCLQANQSVQSLEIEYQDPSGKTGFALFSAEIIDIDNEKCVLSMILDITDRKLAEQNIKISEEKFRLLAENSTDMISRLTPEGVYLYVSPACRSLLGYEPEELLGHSFYEFFHPNDVDQVIQSHETITAQPNIDTAAYRVRCKDGRYIWFETTSRTTRDPDTGTILEIHAASRDITSRKEAEDANRRYAERLELLHDIDQAILRSDQIEVTVTSVLSRLQPLIGFDSASVTAFDSEFRDFTVLAAIAPVPNYRPYEDMSIIELLKRGEIYQVNDLTTRSNLSISDQSLLRAGFHSYVRVPLIAGGKLVASFHMRGLEPNAFSAPEVAIAKEVGAQLAIAIEKIRLLEIEQRRTSELFALHGASLQLTSSLDLEHVLEIILDYASSVVRADDAHLFLYDGEKLTFGTALWEGQKRDKPFKEPRMEGLTYSVARKGERMIVPNVNADPIYENWQWGGAIIGLPLRIGNLVVGVMSLSYTKPHDFDEHEVRILELLADQAAIAIHNAQLYEQIHNHAAELEQRVQERTAELQASETKYRSLIEFAPDPIVIVGADGTITLTNKRAEEWFGYEREELIGQPVEMLLPNQFRDVHTEHRTTYLKDPNQRAMGANLELTALHKNGTETPVKIGLSPVKTERETLIMTYIVDVTADKQLETTLRAALAKEKELNELKTSFTSIVSHEFRTPLAVILSSTDLLSTYGERMDANRRQEKLGNITRQVKRLIQLLDDVLLITRSETTGFVYKPAMLDLVALCEEILDEVRVGYAQNVLIEFDSEGACGRYQTDEFLFSHILQNLASNAVKYSREGGTVHVHVKCSPDVLTLQVQDQGIGIPEKDQARLFESFRRAANVGQIKGTGIGLTIVKRAVDACNGAIAFKSIEGEGTTFTVTLPTANTPVSVPAQDKGMLS